MVKSASLATGSRSKDVGLPTNNHRNAMNPFTDRRQRLANRSPGRWAEVKAVDIKTKRVAIINDWGYAIAELLAGELHINDVVEGCVEVLGPTTWLNLSTDRAVSVDITHIQQTLVMASLLLSATRRQG